MDIDSHILLAPGSTLPEYLYRIVPLKRFVEGCQGSINTLVIPAVWDDPYEAVQLRTELEYPLFEDANGMKSSGMRDNVPRKVGGTWKLTTSAARNVYCQCWSDRLESDAMWRLYSDDKLGVKMRIRSRELLTSLYAATGYDHIFLGSVEYIPLEKFDDLINDAKANYQIQSSSAACDKVRGDRWAKCALRKRTSFDHESEYRLIMTRVGLDSKSDGPDKFQYAFDYNRLIDEVELDPRNSDVDAVLSRIANSGYTGKVTKSRMYEPPVLQVRELWPEDEGWSIGSERKWIKPKQQDG